MTNKLKTLFRLTQNENLILKKCQSFSSLAELTRATSLPRSTVEYTLRKLLDSKLIQIQPTGRRIRYGAIPENTVLKKILLTNEPCVKTYTGVKELLHIWEQVGELPKNTRLYFLQPYNSFKELIKKVSPLQVEALNKKMNDKKFIFEGAVHEKMMRPFFEFNPPELAKKAVLSFTGRLEDVVKIPQEFLNEKAEIFIVHSRLIFIDWYSETGIEIVNEHMANFIKAIFVTIKSYGERFNHGEAIRRGIRLMKR